MSKIPGKQDCVLIVDDEEGIRHGLERLFLKEGYSVRTADGAAAAQRELQDGVIDVALIDIRLKNGRSGLDLIREIKALEPDAVVIVVTGFGSIDTAVAAMKEGAADYLMKPLDNLKLLDSVAKNLQLRALKQENLFLRSELYNKTQRNHQFVSRNPAIASLLDKADKIKNSSVTALISGESGTGKEVLARYIHFTSNRRDGRFVSINCAALSESLLLSELFGHEKGAFTGAVERKPGKFEIANGGTLFLDEIGDMPAEIQAKLLRVLEENSFERVGGTRRISVNVRILAATNKDLQEQIVQGRFRDDLYYRINVVSFRLPPLRERREDIPLLIDHFIRTYNEKYKKAVEGFSPELMSALETYELPGNVRELDNLVNQAVLLSDGPWVHVDSFSKGFGVFRASGHSAQPKSEPAHAPPERGLKEYLSTVEFEYGRNLIRSALAANGFNKSKTAQQLNITRKTLARKINTYRIGDS